jgi:cell shape-determining protein MreD
MMLGTRTNFGWGRVVGLTILALAASVVPLPDAVELLRPDFVALTVLWFCLLSPRLLGLTYAWCAGLRSTASRACCSGSMR